MPVSRRSSDLTSPRTPSPSFGAEGFGITPDAPGPRRFSKRTRRSRRSGPYDRSARQKRDHPPGDIQSYIPFPEGTQPQPHPPAPDYVHPYRGEFYERVQLGGLDIIDRAPPPPCRVADNLNQTVNVVKYRPDMPGA
ncbi:hypothetical protein FA13DRAFT_1717167 [Coprinellus micaceus]|uniref:Uncharacterized protein n=1 Tax=Coprinellus micaceus TaxID=71717 RepID=A0A4Y7SH61_COPMI|nr:hypothetical protein FA13DRAFT_1717167 [Coprinellus micaceus]